MYNEKRTTKEYIRNLLLMNTAMRELITQLEFVVAEDERRNEDA